jgi:hypothetical protein
MIERTDPEALDVAKHIITFVRAGVREPARLRCLAVEAIRVERHKSITHDMGIGKQG